MMKNFRLVRLTSVMAVSATLLAGCMGNGNSVGNKPRAESRELTKEVIAAMSPEQRAAQFPKTLAAGNVWVAGEFWSQAVPEFKRATLLAPNDPAGWLGLGRANAGMKNVDGARSAFETALQLAKIRNQPQHQAKAMHGLFDVASDNDGSIPLGEQAVELYRQTVASGEALADILATLGIRQSKAGRHADAESSLKEALSINRREHRVRGVFWNNVQLGNSFGRSKEPAKAEHHYEQALEFLNKSGARGQDRYVKAIVLGNLGSAKFKLKQFEQSLALHKQALKLRRQLKMVEPSIVALSNIGDVYQHLGDMPAACDYWRQTADLAARSKTKFSGLDEAAKLEKFNCPNA